MINSFFMPGGGGPAGNDPVLQTETAIGLGRAATSHFLLAESCDTTGATISTAPDNVAPSGGWDFVCGCTAAEATCSTDSTYSFHATVDSLPELMPGRKQAVLDGPASAAIRLAAGADLQCKTPCGAVGCGLRLVSPRVRVEAGQSYVLGGWMRAAL